MSPAGVAALTGLACFPRVSGDEPGDIVILTDVMQFSPRERG